jgi:lantibiotic biosynthesis protein
MKDRIHQKLEAIYYLLKSHELTHYSLHAESGGKLLFLYEYAKYTQKQEIIAEFENALGLFVENFSITPSPTFCNGMMGNVWLLAFFKKEGITDDLLQDIQADINTSFEDWAESFVEDKNYDFLHGLLGLLFAGQYSENIDAEILKKFADKMLTDIKIENDKAYFIDWMPHKEYDVDGAEKINISLAHGIPAGMVTFAAMSEIDKRYEKVAIQIGNFMYANRKRKTKESLYGSVLYDRVQSEEDSRLGWCYGDLGIALAFWQTGKKLNHDPFLNEALRIMHNATKRKDSISNAINDCGLCHGSAGVAQIFRRFWWETKETVFLEAANYWTEQTLEMAIHKEGLVGYCVYRAVGENKWITDIGLLEGVAGIGLALISALQEEPNNWDKSLMMS